MQSTTALNAGQLMRDTLFGTSDREAKLAELDERLQDLRDSVVDGHGLRLDGTIQDPTSGELVWFDVSVVHTTSRSYLKDEAKFSRLPTLFGSQRP